MVLYLQPDWDRFKLICHLNIYGEDGWKLVSVSKGIAYFKRKVHGGEKADE